VLPVRVWPIALLLTACSDISEPWPDNKVGRVEGSATITPGLQGDVWAFLYAPGEGPPGPPAVPLFATAVSSERVSAGDRRYVFGAVAPNPYRLWGFLDVNSNFDPSVDVLSQPGAGDRTVADGTELNLQPGQVLHQDIVPATEVPDEPPAFSLQGNPTDVPLDSTPGNPPVTLTMVSDALGRLDPKRTAFHVGLVDANGDGRPDVDSNGVPQLTLQIFLRWLPRPGEDSGQGFVIVPLAIDPSPFLSELNGRVGIEVAVTQLQGAVIAQADRLVVAPGKAPSITVVGAAPRGDYELIALTPAGQFWRLPNDLRGVEPSQGVRFHFDRSGQ
jgi:hypothetical protein